MRFAAPYLLLLLLAVPLLLRLYLRGRKHHRLLFSDGQALAALPVGPAVRLQGLQPLCFTAGLIALIIALARPQTGLDQSHIRTEAVDIIMLLDVSTSMNETDFLQNRQPVTRIQAAKTVMRQFVENRENDRIGMVAFAALPYSLAPLTLDHDWVLQRLGWIQTGMLEDGTAIGDAIASAVNRLRESEAKSRVVILLTDGANNRGELSPENAALAARALGIKVYTIGIGGAQVRRGFFSTGGADFDEPSLQRIAQTTGARYFRAGDLPTLEQVYAAIDELEKTEIETERFTRYQERFSGWAVAGFLLLGLESLLRFSKYGRLPL
jgi:Ca-activated chloride channel homolog